MAIVLVFFQLHSFQLAGQGIQAYEELQQSSRQAAVIPDKEQEDSLQVPEQGVQQEEVQQEDMQQEEDQSGELQINGQRTGEQKNDEKDIVNPEQVYTYNKLTEDVQKLSKDYPELIQYKSLGKTAYNRDIWAVRLGRGEASVMINASHHGREWLTTNVVMYMMDRYAQAFAKKESFEGYDVETLLNQASIWFIPMVNPDGVTLQQEGPDAFPEEVRAALQEWNGESDDFKRWKSNGQGIDLNHQYPADWENIAANAPGPFFEHYKGSEPLVAEEARAIVDFTRSIDPEVTVSYHSTGRIIYWHFYNKPENVERDRQMASALSEMTGYQLVPPVPNPSGGGYKDWFIQEFDRPGFTLEIGSYVHETNLPLSVFYEEWESNKKVGLYIAEKGYELWSKRRE